MPQHCTFSAVFGYKSHVFMEMHTLMASSSVIIVLLYSFCGFTDNSSTSFCGFTGSYAYGSTGSHDSIGTLILMVLLWFS